MCRKRFSICDGLFITDGKIVKICQKGRKPQWIRCEAVRRGIKVLPTSKTQLEKRCTEQGTPCTVIQTCNECSKAPVDPDLVLESWPCRIYDKDYKDGYPDHHPAKVEFAAWLADAERTIEDIKKSQDASGHLSITSAAEMSNSSANVNVDQQNTTCPCITETSSGKGSISKETVPNKTRVPARQSRNPRKRTPAPPSDSELSDPLDSPAAKRQRRLEKHRANMPPGLSHLQDLGTKLPGFQTEDTLPFPTKSARASASAFWPSQIASNVTPTFIPNFTRPSIANLPPVIPTQAPMPIMYNGMSNRQWPGQMLQRHPSFQTPLLQYGSLGNSNYLPFQAANNTSRHQDFARMNAFQHGFQQSNAAQSASLTTGQRDPFSFGFAHMAPLPRVEQMPPPSVHESGQTLGRDHGHQPWGTWPGHNEATTLGYQQPDSFASFGRTQPGPGANQF